MDVRGISTEARQDRGMALTGILVIDTARIAELVSELEVAFRRLDDDVPFIVTEREDIIIRIVQNGFSVHNEHIIRPILGIYLFSFILSGEDDLRDVLRYE